MSTKVDPPAPTPPPPSKVRQPDASERSRAATQTPRHTRSHLRSQPYTPSDLPREAKQVHQLLMVLHKAYQAFSFYPFNHPIVQQFSSQLYQALCDFFELAPYLELRIDRFRILYYEEVVFEESNVNNNFVYQLYSDGIRKLIFDKGLRLDECFAFFAILHRCSGRRSLHDDVVTLMWEAGFEHIRYFLLEDLSTTFLPSFAALSGEYQAVDDEAVAPAVKVSTSGAQSSDGEFALRTVKQLARSRVELKDAETHLLESMRHEEEAELMHRFLEVLTLLLDHHKESPQLEPLIRVLSQLQPIVVALGTIEDMLLCFRYIKHIATQLRERGTELARQWSQSLFEALPDAFSEQAIQRLSDELQRHPTDQEIQSLVVQYIEYVELPSSALLLEPLAGLTHPEARDVWCNALAHKYQETPRQLSPGLGSPHQAVAVATCEIIGQIGREEAWNALERGAQSDAIAVRIAALNAMLQLDTSETTTIRLIELVEHALADDHPEVRTAAIEGLAELGPNAIFLLKALFEYRTYEHWTPDEMSLLFGKAAQLGNYYSEALDHVVDLLLQHYNSRFTSRKKLDVARIALLALQRENTPQSAQAIERIYQRASKPLRRICESIFQS